VDELYTVRMAFDIKIAISKKGGKLQKVKSRRSGTRKYEKKRESLKWEEENFPPNHSILYANGSY